MKKELITEKIKELIPQAPPDWADTIAAMMDKSTDSIYAYARGNRGIRAGYHKEVLRILKELVAEENKRTKDLLS